MSFKDEPNYLKPKEKALRYGINKLQDAELLAIILNTGYKNTSVLQLANNLIINGKGLANLNKLSYNDLTSFKGISKHKALQILSIFEIANRLILLNLENQNLHLKQYLINKYQTIFLNATREHFYVIYLNNLNKILKEELLYQGLKNHLICSKKEIVDKAKQNNAKKIIIIHNHNLSNFKPSDEDIIFTKDLKYLCLKYDIILLDHIIIYKKAYFSFKECLNS